MACISRIVIKTKAGLSYVACKQCLPCRIRKQSSLSLRALLEYQTSFSGEFVTLTYAEAPERIDYSDFQSFLKRYRDWNRRSGNRLPIRYLGVGEYGAKSGRAHFHALIYNGLPFSPEVWRTKLWPQGFSYIGQITPASIRYTARYTLKFAAKGQEGIAHWSKRPGLGADGIRQLASYMRDNGYKLPEPFTTVRIEGRTYALDDFFRKTFLREFTGQDSPPTSKPHRAMIDYHLEKIFGDPTAERRIVSAQKKAFWTKVQAFNEKV